MNTRVNVLARVLPALGLSLLLVACGDQSSLSEPSQEELVRPIRAIQLGMKEEFAQRRFPGRAAASNDVTLAFEVPGKLKQVLVSVGQRVKQGEVLARLDSRDYQNALDQALAEMKSAESRYERMKRALADNAVSKQGVSDALAAFDGTKALVKIRKKAVTDSSLVAPYDAIVSTVFVDNFQNIQAKQPAIRLVDPSKIEMDGDIPETLISFAKVGMEAFVRFSVFPDTVISARIKEVGTEASETTRTYPVTLIMDQPEDVTILPGMAGEAWPSLEAFDLSRSPDKFHGYDVPLSAILKAGDGHNYVWVIDEQSGQVSRQKVELGSLTKQGVLIRGVPGGAYVATAGVHVLKENQKVRILP